MVENKITKLKKLIDEHYENIDKIIKQEQTPKIVLDTEVNEVENEMLRLLNDIEGNLDTINSNFKKKNIKEITENEVKRYKSAIGLVSALFAHEIKNSLKSDKIVDFSSQFKEIMNFILMNNKEDDQYIDITKTIYLMIEYINSVLIKTEYKEYYLKFSSIVNNLRKIRILLIINNSNISEYINEIENKVNKHDDYHIKLEMNKKIPLIHHINIIKETLETKKNINNINYNDIEQYFYTININIENCLSLLVCNRFNPYNIKVFGYNYKNNIMCDLIEDFTYFGSFFYIK